MAKEPKKEKSVQDTSHSVNVPSRQSERAGSDADKTVNFILRLRIAEISRLKAWLQRVERKLSLVAWLAMVRRKGVNNARFRSHVSAMKRLVR